MGFESPSQKLFLSDVHLGGFSKKENRRIEQELIHLIDYCQADNIKIYVLGDMFDYWMEYPGHVPDLGIDLRKRFKEYNKEFAPTLYITGNHDNWTRNYFEKIGFTLKQNYETMKIGRKKTLVLHGDGVFESCGSLKRPSIHRLLRNKRFVHLYQTLLPPKAGLIIMKWFSQINRFLGELKPDASRLNKWAEMHLKETQTDLIICGHDHIPRKINFPFGTYLNLGTFYKHKTAALYNNHSIELVVWNDASRQLTNFIP